jgi:hypothetical protein
LLAPSTKHPANGASCDSAVVVVEAYCTLIAHVLSTHARILAKAALRLVEVSSLKGENSQSDELLAANGPETAWLVSESWYSQKSFQSFFSS